MIQNNNIFFPYSYFTESGSYDFEDSEQFELELRMIKGDLCLERPSEEYDEWLETDKFLFNYFDSDFTKMLLLLKQITDMNEDLHTLKWNYMLRRFKMYFIVLFLQNIWIQKDGSSPAHECSDYCLGANNETCRMKQFVVPQGTTSMENQILQFFDSFKVTVHDIQQSMKNAWNEKGTRLDETFIDHAYKFCICKILDQKPILLKQMIGLGALAPQLIANDTKRVVSVLSNSSRNWFMPFQLRNSFHITEPQRMISCIGLIPILTKTMEIEKYERCTSPENQHPYTSHMTHIHFFGVVNLDNIF